MAIKQFPKDKKNETNFQSAQDEIKWHRTFYKPNNEPYDQYKDHPGLDSLCKLQGQREDKFDLWLIYELCGSPLSKLLFQPKGTFYKGERIYEVQQDPRIMNILQRNNC